MGTTPIYGTDAFGDADGRYLVALMRRLQTPIASRWAEIMLRRALIGATPAPRGEGQADWVADRAALLLRLGEADAARMLVQGVDVERFSPRLRRVAIESALATSDPQGLCPLSDGDEQVGGQPAWPMIRAMCATLAGDEATANATIGRGPPNDFIDHPLAERLVAAPAGLLGDGAADLPPEERARRERARERAGGIVAFGADRDLTVAAFALAGRLFVAELTAGGAGVSPAPPRELAGGGVLDPRVDPTGRLDREPVWNGQRDSARSPRARS